MEFVQPIREIAQIEAIKKALLDKRPYGLRDHLLFTLGINSALRISDLLGLKIKDVVDSKGSINGYITLREKKTGKSKAFPLNNNAVRAIKMYLQSIKPEPCEFLFRSKKGGALTRQQAWHILNEAALMCGITDRIGTHTLRKTFGYHAFKNGIGIECLQTILNHSSPGTTLRYIGITQDDVDSVYMGLNL